jgi:hypothetical protein
MKLLTSDQFELMEVTGLRTEGKNLVVVGTIMGAMPTEAILTPVELRKVFKLLSFRTFAFVVKMLVSA